MKNLLIILIVLFAAAGCGEKQKETPCAPIIETIVAKWVDNSPNKPSLVYLVNDNIGDGQIMITQYDDCSTIEKKVWQDEYKGDGRVIYNYKNNKGEYYVIEDNDNLCLYNSNGIIKKLEMLKN